MTEQRSSNVAEATTVASLLVTAEQQAVARLDAEVLLAALRGTSRATLLAFGEVPVDAMTAALFAACVQRRAAGEPLAYITGIKEFWSMPLVVTPAVLVPRPETELLVERGLALFDAAPRRVADLGTGSGAIALALARERPAWSIVATDASPAALEIAANNCQRLNIGNVELRRGIWCAALGTERFDAILSNPPYVAADDAALTLLEHEPRSALVAPDDGYADLLHIAAAARDHLHSGGALLLEHGASQAARLRAALGTLGFEQIQTWQDLAGLDRVTGARWP
jgi:release factor glutamine methyltransferase